ncbi:hypothetical protein TRVL_06701 [Trypanosoma vivax]|nr:hypothetical protein TRVL_06701 [Trypanosoma vivax]
MKHSGRSSRAVRALRGTAREARDYMKLCSALKGPNGSHSKKSGGVSARALLANIFEATGADGYVPSAVCEHLSPCFCGRGRSAHTSLSKKRTGSDRNIF